jgi:hypothetical protein
LRAYFLSYQGVLLRAYFLSYQGVLLRAYFLSYQVCVAAAVFKVPDAKTSPKILGDTLLGPKVYYPTLVQQSKCS